MPVFAVHYVYDPKADLDSARPAHRAYLQTLAEQGLVVASGPYADVEAPAALLVFHADDASVVQDLLDDDPFQHAGFISEATITRWQPVIGQLSHLS